MKVNRIYNDLCYIPDWNGNLSLPEHEQVRVWFDIIPTREREQIQRSARIGGTDEVDWVLVNRLEVIRSVKKIENLELDGTVIDNGQKLMDYAYRPEDLVTLISFAIHQRREKAAGQIKEVAKN